MAGDRPRLVVFGPAYLDHVLEIRAPLLPPDRIASHFEAPEFRAHVADLLGARAWQVFVQALEATPWNVDWSVAARHRSRGTGRSISVAGEAGDDLHLSLPEESSLAGSVQLQAGIVSPSSAQRLLSRLASAVPAGVLDLAVEWCVNRPLTVRGCYEVARVSEDLGGMGAGFAAALSGTLCFAAGAGSDGRPCATAEKVIGRLRQHRVAVHPVAVPGHAGDETFLITSGSHGDKLPIGLRNALLHYPSEEAAPLARDADLVVVAGLPNPRMETLLNALEGRRVLLAPAMRNTEAPDFPFEAAGRTTFCLGLNESEWRGLAHRQQLLDAVPLVIVTRGRDGARLHFRVDSGERVALDCEAFRPELAPVDTNRAGETFAATFMTALFRHWGPEAVRRETFPREAMAEAVTRASVAASLQLRMPRFGFPEDAEIERHWPASELIVRENEEGTP